MTRFMLPAGLAVMLVLTCAPRAEARIFEPQHDWWHSGRICIDSRAPAGGNWDAPPPRACVEGDTAVTRKQPRGEELAFKGEIWAAAFVEDKRAEKAAIKPNGA
ncbi:MAG: hypothetical protein WAU68_02245 [Vitreimonas sp.]